MASRKIQVAFVGLLNLSHGRHLQSRNEMQRHTELTEEAGQSTRIANLLLAMRPLNARLGHRSEGQRFHELGQQKTRMSRPQCSPSKDDWDWDEEQLIRRIQRQNKYGDSSSFPNYRASQPPERKFSGLRRRFSALSNAASAVPLNQYIMVLMAIAFGAQSLSPRIAMGVGCRLNAAIVRHGEWHRLVTPVFLHGGGYHLMSNLLSLWRVGPQVEQAFGKSRALLLFLVSGICGNLAGLWFGDPRVRSVGASGAVFGMMGAIIGYVNRNRQALGTAGEMMQKNVFGILLLNLFFGMRSPQIDNLAHVGGFVGGALLGMLVAPKKHDEYYWSPYEEAYFPTKEKFTLKDGALLPRSVIRLLLAATCLYYAIGLQQAYRIAAFFMRRYGRV